MLGCFPSQIRSIRRGIMAGRIEARLAELKIELPKAAIPVANYVPVVTAGNLAFVSGQVRFGTASSAVRAGSARAQDRRGLRRRACAPLNAIAQLKNALGDLDREACAKLTVFINSANESPISRR
jgi:enamine deaminase RidA (YjgF/YER057c/UK114 family)